MITSKLNNLAAVSVHGEDAASFLQAQLTANLEPLENGDSCFAAYCEPKGNVLAVLWVQKRELDFLIVMAETLRDSVLNRLRMYVLRSRVEFKPLEDSVVGWQENDALEYGVDPSGEAADDAAHAMAWRAMELRRGVTWLGPETAGQFLPQMLGLDRLGAVSFNKGCFPGQEIIARLRYLGKLKRFPCLLRTDAELAVSRGDELILTTDDGNEDKAIVVDSAVDADANLLLVVTRINPETPPGAMVISGQSVAVEPLSQAWATM